MKNVIPGVKALTGFVASAILLFSVSNVYARDEIRAYSIADALASEKAKAILGDNIKFYFGDTVPEQAIKRNIAEYRHNRKTNASNKSDTEACQWVFLSALKDLRDSAVQNGANAVINIKSNYRNNLTTSNDTFQCGAGALVAGVALVGDVAILE